MNDDIKKEPTNRYSTRLRTSLRHINYAEDYSEFNYDSESSDDNRIYSRRINLNTSLSKNRKRRKIFNEKDSSVYIKLDRNSNNYETEINDNSHLEDIQNDNENIQEIEDDNDTMNENEIENVDEINTNKNNQNCINIKEEDINNNNLSNSTETNRYNTRYNTRSHYKKLIVNPVSAETTKKSQNISNINYIKSLNEDDIEEYLKNKNNIHIDNENENNENTNQSGEERNENRTLIEEDVGSKIIEDDLENSFGKYI
ncbi:hypothetical protein PIROE2DRAFT_2024 [Piromyces sp. E2]|nr:hypothetical protein PIROE2DRAFT_2024 [Piromyces sp. E2]|eukprot:OUM69846.1 hypothetical protein PIROE2DRAFT_2024 [Piromyces sp. E2]